MAYARRVVMGSPSGMMMISNKIKENADIERVSCIACSLSFDVQTSSSSFLACAKKNLTKIRRKKNLGHHPWTEVFGP